MKSNPTITLKTEAKHAWIAVLDPASGRRGVYTVYRLHRWGAKHADIVGRELDLATARKVVRKGAAAKADKIGFEHQCNWREASIKLAKCVAATIQTGGKIGMGSGMLMKVVNGKKTIERWDKDFIEALAFIGFEIIDKKPKRARRAKAA